MTELASKSGTKSIIWDYFGLEVEPDEKPVSDGSVVLPELLKAIACKTRKYLKLVGSLTNKPPALYSLVKVAMEGKGKQPACKATTGPQRAANERFKSR